MSSDTKLALLCGACGGSGAMLSAFLFRLLGMMELAYAAAIAEAIMAVLLFSLAITCIVSLKIEQFKDAE